MRCDISVDSGICRISFQYFPKSLSAHGFPGAVRKQCTLICIFCKKASGMLHILQNRITTDISNRDDTFFVTVMAYHIAHLKIDICSPEMNQFADTHARCIQKFHHRIVTDTLRCADIRLFQQTVYFLNRKDLRQFLLNLRCM